MKNQDETKVIFRKYKSDGEIIAIFPEEITNNPNHCLSYIHVGQHGDCDPGFVTDRSTTSLAKPEEYKSLYDELVRIGYVLKVTKRFQYKSLEIRRQKLNDLK